MLKGLFVLDIEQGTYQRVYNDGGAKAQINRLVDIYAEPQTAASIKQALPLLNEADVIFSSWGAPLLDREFLSHAPKLKMIFYGAGSVKYMVTEEFWNRGIRLTSAYVVGAIPVAEFTLSQIIFCLKRGWHYSRYISKHKTFPPDYPVTNTKGMFGTTIGIVSLGMIGKLVCRKLKDHDVKVIAYDPFATRELAAELNVQLCSLEDVFSLSDVVSIHTPLLKETEGMIKGSHFASMKFQASFINTARGAVIRENEMAEVLRKRDDLQAVLDVTYPEPPIPGSPLYTLPNVVITPHLAGGSGWEVRRMGQFIVDELKRYLKGEPLIGELTKEQAQVLA